MGTVASILGGEKELGQKIQGPFDFDSLIKKGMPSGVIYYMKKEFNLTDETLALITGISLRTIARRRKTTKGETAKERLSPVESDRLYRFARIIALAEEVFENKADAMEWLKSPQHGLGGVVPFEMLQTGAGTREVEDLLVRIEYGVIS